MTLSTKYNRATTGDYAKAVRVAQYVFGTKDEHCLVLRPESLQIVATSDAADGIHSNGRGHTGGTVVRFNSSMYPCLLLDSKQQAILHPVLAG